MIKYTYISTDFGQNNNAQGGSLQVRLLQINYEVNAKSRLEIIIIIRSTYYYWIIIRSTGKLLLDHPKGKMLTTLGTRSFSAVATKLWNSLPVELRQATSLNSFKSRLETYLFKKHFYSL